MSKSIFQERRKQFLPTILKVLFKTILFLFPVIMLAQEVQQSWIGLPQNDMDALGEYRIAIYNSTQNVIVKDSKFSMSSDCDPCQFHISIDPELFSSFDPVLRFFGGDSIGLISKKLIPLRSINEFDQNEGLYLLDEYDETYKLDIYANKGQFVAISLMSYLHYENKSMAFNYEKRGLFYLIYNGILGALLLIFFLNLFGFFITSRYEHLYYALYAIIVGVYLFTLHLDLFLDIDDDQKFFLIGWIRRITQPLFYACYYQFIIHFLETKNKYPFGHKTLQFFTGFSLLTSALFSIILLIDHQMYNQSIFDVYRMVIAIYSVVLIAYMAQFIKDRLVMFMILGGLFLLIGAMLSWVFTIKQIGFLGFGPILYLIIGIFLELIMFSSGLAYKSKKIEDEKNKVQVKLIGEMQTNQKLVSDRSKFLETEVDRIKTEMENEISAKIKSQLDLKMKNLELDALVAQMNPHFLFNSMNSLKSQIMQEKTDEAAAYLDSLAKLFRGTMDNIQSRFVNLKDEMSFISEYIKLENKRFGGKIEFALLCENEDELETVEIPSMLIQPIVENAIWHGLTNSQKDEFIIKISIRLLDKMVAIIIEDNGIGYSISKANSKNEKHKSYSSVINQKRLEMLYNGRASLSFRDLKKDGVTQGTEVELLIPYST